MEPFTFVERRADSHHLFDDVVKCTSGKSADHDLQYIAALRKAFPDLIVTACPASNAPLRAFATSGYATCELDKETDSYASWRGFSPPENTNSPVGLAESVWFAKYHYRWKYEDFILYTVGPVQYILKETRDGEDRLGPSKLTDQLIMTVGSWIFNVKDVVWVYDGWWSQSRSLWEEVQKASWDDVILDEKVKNDLKTIAHKFFDSRDVYKSLGVPWKRGVLFHGPPGNGKTVSVKALMHSLSQRDPPIQSLYVKKAEFKYEIGEVFSQARSLAPCMLILEDVETIVTPGTRSYFFNEMDGIRNNDGLFIVGSTNFLDRLDPGLSKRPSRFDRKFLFPLPNEYERTLYCEYWRQKLESNKTIVFPEKLCPAMANITSGFSFAYLQECFVATLVSLAQDRDDSTAIRPFDAENDDLDDYELWVTFKRQADILRKQIEDQTTRRSSIFKSLADSTDENGRSISQSGQHCHCYQSGDSKRHTPVTRAMGQLRVKGEPFPELPYDDTKHEMVNTTAFERRHF